MAIFCSLNLYGMQNVSDLRPTRLFSPTPTGEARKDLSEELYIVLEQYPKLAQQLKQAFITLYDSLIVRTESGFAIRSDKGPEYKQFGYFLVEQLLCLGKYNIYDIWSPLHDNRQSLLYCWLEINLLTRYGNSFFERESFSHEINEFEQVEFVKALHCFLLPAFCMALKDMKSQCMTELQ